MKKPWSKLDISALLCYNSSRGDTLRPATIVFSLILILILAFCAFFYTGGTLQAQVNSITASAADYPDAFSSIQSVIATGTAPQLFTADPLDDPANYTLVDVSMTLTNRGVFDAEWLNIQVEGVTGDVAVYSLTGDGADVPARSAVQTNLKLITRAPENSLRSISIQYYVYGISRTIDLQV